jgi:hypothetical protein
MLALDADRAFQKGIRRGDRTEQHHGGQMQSDSGINPRERKVRPAPAGVETGGDVERQQGRDE